MAGIGAIIQLLVIILPEIINLIKSLKSTPQEQRQKALEEVRAAMQAARLKLGNTKPIEDVINK
jgi:hypothetical protein